MISADLGFQHRWVEGKNSEKTIIALHGTGGDENDLIPLVQQLVGEDANILSPRGRVLEGGMPRFFRRLAPGIYDWEDLRNQTDALAEFLVKSAEFYQFSLKKATFLGYSNGANIAAWTLIQRPEVVDKAVLLRPLLPIQGHSLPLLEGKSILIGGGQRDIVVPGSASQDLTHLFTNAGAEVQLYWHSGGHELGSQDLETVKVWLESR
jgi:phospholipase/carboxylesterase